MTRNRAGIALAALVLLSCASGPALAQQRPLDLRRIEGDYALRFRNSLVGGETYWSTDRLRIVRHGEAAAYISLDLHFYNDHTCSLSGIAARQGAALVYRKPDAPDYDCRLTMRVAKRALVFSDADNRCRRMTCGARGGYGGREFALRTRRPLKSASAFRRSAEFKETVETFERLPKEEGKKTGGKP